MTLATTIVVKKTIAAISLKSIDAMASPSNHAICPSARHVEASTAHLGVEENWSNATPA